MTEIQIVVISIMLPRPSYFRSDPVFFILISCFSPLHPAKIETSNWTILYRSFLHLFNSMRHVKFKKCSFNAQCQLCFNTNKRKELKNDLNFSHG